ncbi:TPA: chemotaxis protein [Escherichia coli]|uniref:Chemotaxis protein n=2 Tax=Escherichia coli TaxID=562 RepID=A0A272D4R8_ECOLX|nr:chemotaxis protein [Escherichia coli]EFA5393393.1 chemotaxis protein [Escherichia coli O6]ATV51319.1 chemotaxis protein [Escherichia coli]ATV78579.1 chemotaxis protein [Escherichia coli]ATX49981.1 chemotaxis protein [Escherichia coli]
MSAAARVYTPTCWRSVDIAVTNGAIVIHTQRLKSDPGGNLLS